MDIGARYKVGHDGLRVIFDDGVEMVIPARRVIRFTEQPKAIIGRMYRVNDDGTLAFEVPELRRPA